MAKVKCPRCEHINEDGADACARCGSALPRVKTGPAAPAARPSGNGQNTVVFRPGQVIAGRYTVIGMIGRGGMGCIYRVRDNVLQEDVALKTLLPQFAREKMVVDRFFNEARIARALSHPNIVRVHDIGMASDLLYISMELIRGRSLRNMLEQLPPGQRLPARTTLRVMDELCAALEYAHRHTVHRDIKPENVMVCEDGSVKLMDFGISKLMDARGLTSTSMIMGTPYYMSPEQQRDSANVDARADIYSLGVMLYEILTGNMPTGVPKPASQLRREVPPALDPIVAQCVDPDPAERYQNATQLREALRQIAKYLESGAANDEAAAERARARARTKRRLLGVLLVVVILLGAGFGLRKLEERRAALLQGAEEESIRVAAAENQEQAFAPLVEIAEKLREGAAVKTGGNPLRDAALKTADEQWARAKAAAAGNAEQAYHDGLSAAQTYYGLVVCPDRMAVVPGGEAILRDATGGNVVRVAPFLIDLCEVTNADFLRFCQATQWRPTSVLMSAVPTLPVSVVTFYDAQAYAAWAGEALGLKAQGLTMSLPTEAQWARAAHGSDEEQFLFPWGAKWEPNAANIGTGGPTPVGRFEKDLSWCGCSDMVGNVSEWTRSLWRALPYQADDGREDPKAIWFGSLLTIRGGAFGDLSPVPLSTRRSHGFNVPLNTVGFRCVVELPSRVEDLAKGL